MARAGKRTTTRKPAKTTRATPKVSPRSSRPASLNNMFSQDWLKQLQLNESYISLLLGAVVVVVLSAVFFIFIKENNFKEPNSFPSSQAIPSGIQSQQRSYTLKDGEGLWDVAVKFYGDGYKWTEIAKANNLTEEQANALGPGAKVIVPNLK